MRAEHLAQRPVQDVGRGVVAADRVAARAVDRGDDLVALDQLALLDLAPGARLSTPAIAYCVSSTRTTVAPSAVVIVPVSPTWPPDSA